MSAIGTYDLSEQDAAVLKMVADSLKIGIATERQRCVEIVDAWLDSQTMLLRAGEMTAQEQRTVKSVVAAISRDIRNGGND